MAEAKKEGNVVKELTDLLAESGIEEFDLDASEKTLTINYREDFDKFFPKLNASPQVLKDRWDLPYGATHFAFFNYKDWKIRGNIVHYKPS